MSTIKSCIVTGCFGFIGNNLTDKLLSEGWFVYGIDKIDYVSDTSQLQAFTSTGRFEFIHKDILDIDWLPVVDVIFNLAANSHVDNSIIDSSNFIRNNVQTVQHLLSILDKQVLTSVDKPLFFHFSTDEVYGDRDRPCSEIGDLIPSNPYSATKAAADLLIQAWARTYNLEYIIVDHQITMVGISIMKSLYL